MNAAAGIGRLAAATRDACEQRLASDDILPVREQLVARGVSYARSAELLSIVTEAPSTTAVLGRLRDDIGRAAPVQEGQVERCLLLGAAVHVIPELPRVPVSLAVQAMICDEFQYVASADAGALAKSALGTSRFIRLAKIATFRRYPAGQFEWEVAGIGRRDVMGVDPWRLPGTIAFVLRRMGGLGPVFFSHLNPRRQHRSLREDEANRSYFHMAQAMAMQPHIRGFAACSWFRAPSTHRVSPHLAWLSRVFLENGGWVVDGVREAEDCGVFYGSATRRRLYETGRFTPRRGLVMWPRRAMLEWAAAHPEFAGA